MSESVNAIVVKQLAALVAIAAVAIAVVVGGGWWLVSRSAASAPPRVPASSVDQCEVEIRRKMQNPATVKFLAGGVSTMVRDNGGYLVRRSFKASNAFGMESQMRGVCVFPPGGGEPEVIFTE